MNRTEAIGLIERFITALNAGDFDAAIACLHEDVVHDTGGENRAFGQSAFRESLVRRQAETNEELGDVVIMASDDGTRAAAEFTRRGRSDAGAGKHYSVAGGMFFAIEDATIIRVSPCGAFSGAPTGL